MRYSELHFKTLITWFVPTFLRKVKQIKWLYSLLSPFISLYNNTLHKMQHDGRVIYLEKVLNEKCKVYLYHPDQHQNTKKIYITDTYTPISAWLYIEKEEKPIYEFATLWTQDELNTVSEVYSDFTVHIPMALNVNMNVIKGVLDYFKMAGKRYDIKIK